jgi:hypothetical protein
MPDDDPQRVNTINGNADVEILRASFSDALRMTRVRKSCEIRLRLCRDDSRDDMVGVEADEENGVGVDEIRMIGKRR